MYDYEHLLFEKRPDHVGVLTLNSPDRLNAISYKMHDELEAFFLSVNADQDVRAIVLTGAGKGFCAGGDVKEASELRSDADARHMKTLTFSRSPRRLIVAMLEVEVPIVVAVNGVAAGLGASVALLGDIVIASENARIGDTHVKVGLVAGDGGAVIWPLLVGVNRAKELLMRGTLLSAAEAERLGLVNHVVPGATLMEEALAVASELATGPTWAIRWTKASINKIVRERLNLLLDTSLAFEALSSVTEDYLGAARAFAERRTPEFRGR